MSAPTFDVPAAQFIRLDLFPALLHGTGIPGADANGVLDGKRVIVTDSYILMFSDTQTGPQLVWSDALVDIEGRNTIGWTITTESGANFLVRRSTGCGCGSKLRGIFPYPGVPYKPQSD